MEIRNHFVRNIIVMSQIPVRHNKSEDNESDSITKPLRIVKFEKFRIIICVHAINQTVTGRQGDVKTCNHHSCNSGILTSNRLKY